jgi:hypothetical protein
MDSTRTQRPAGWADLHSVRMLLCAMAAPVPTVPGGRRRGLDDQPRGRGRVPALRQGRTAYVPREAARRRQTLIEYLGSIGILTADDRAEESDLALYEVSEQANQTGQRARIMRRSPHATEEQTLGPEAPPLTPWESGTFHTAGNSARMACTFTPNWASNAS